MKKKISEMKPGDVFEFEGDRFEVVEGGFRDLRTNHVIQLPAYYYTLECEVIGHIGPDGVIIPAE